ncbi:MAG: hypothetical protein A2V62_06915 [Nitrospirae bacterium RBG_19FT_COMBO_58_9]|nr:MAG: hypothetical protein A2V62_06915 [Nitrospirae bacterium RBG_19FT_COMBO_58_9]
MKAVVTGATGVVGANLVRQLLKAGHEVTVFVRETSNLSHLEGLPVTRVVGDILNLESLARAAAGCDWLFHAASVFSYWGHRAADLEQIAVEGVTNAVEAAHQSGVGRVILTGSSVVHGSNRRKEVGNEHGHLGEPSPAAYLSVKAHQHAVAFERAAERGVELVAVCPTIVVGPFDTRLSPSNASILDYLTDPWKVTFPGGCNIVSARDVAQGHILAATAGRPGECYILGSENLEWPAIHSTISDLCGVPGPNFQANHTSSYLTATAWEMMSWVTGKPPKVTRDQAKMVGRYYWYSHEKAAALGFSPMPAREALAEAISWLVTSQHVSAALRRSLTVSSEVYQARKRWTEEMGASSVRA